MKNIYKILFVVISMIAVSCDPLEDTYNELDEEVNSGFVKDVEYELIDDDYDTINGVCNCSGFGSFSSEDDAKENIPLALLIAFPALGETSSALVTYDLFNGSSPDLRGDYNEYIVTGEEYTELGYRFGSFSDLNNDLSVYAAYKKPEASDGDYMDVTHAFFTGSSTVDTLSRAVYTVAYGWQYTMILPDAVYGDFFGESGIDFSDSDEGEEKMPAYLNYLVSSASDYNSINVEEGSTIVVQYNYDDRCFDDDCEDPGEANVPDVALYIFQSGTWIPYSEIQTSPIVLSFGHNGETWVPDNTIKYTFSTADFTVAGDEANGLGNAAARDNLRTFGNFGTDWSEEEIYDAINFVLKLNFPDNEVGQKYIVTYDTYPAGDLQVNLILDESGDYIEITE